MAMVVAVVVDGGDGVDCNDWWGIVGVAIVSVCNYLLTMDVPKRGDKLRGPVGNTL